MQERKRGSTVEARRRRVEAARGDWPLDLLIEGVQLVNVYTREIYPADIGIAGGYIAHAGTSGWDGPEPRQRLLAEGRFAVPGLVDTHVHIESSMMSPAGFAAAVLPRGTTTVVIDPHEIGNVLGLRGVQYMLQATAQLPLRVYVQVPSCVPAVPDLESAGAAFGPREVAEMLSWDRVVGLAEVMDYVGVIQQTERMRGILEEAIRRDKVISGHCPTLRGRELAAYLMAGPDSDHEGVNRDELLEKLRQGMVVEGRVSSFSESMTALGDIVRQLQTAPPNLVMCTDDVFPEDLLSKGHMDAVIRQGVASGLPAIDAVRAATLHGAQRHRLFELGAIAPGKRADIVLVQDLQHFLADQVFVDGKLVAQADHMLIELPRAELAVESENTVHLPHPPLREDFLLRARPGRTRERIYVMDMQPANRMRRLEVAEFPVQHGVVDFRAVERMSLVTILERHGRTGRRGQALVRDLGLREGAVASTVAHDSHNLIVIGRDADDMALAASELMSCGGGICCTRDGQVLALLPLPIAGLMSPLPAEELLPIVQKLNAALRELGIVTRQPIAAVIGMALPVVPPYSITDMGLVDVEQQKIIPIWADQE